MWDIKWGRLKGPPALNHPAPILDYMESFYLDHVYRLQAQRSTVEGYTIGDVRNHMAVYCISDEDLFRKIIWDMSLYMYIENVKYEKAQNGGK